MHTSEDAAEGHKFSIVSAALTNSKVSVMRCTFGAGAAAAGGEDIAVPWP